MKIINSNYMVVTVKEPVLWERVEGEVWLLNPPRRYILNADLLQDEGLAPHIATCSELRNSGAVKQLSAGVTLADRRILVERNRDRGVGDLLFLTGPLEYIRHVSGDAAKVDVYALADRGQVLLHHPSLRCKTTFAGPLACEDLALYDFHWFIDSVTECNEERDQLNVYDALFQQLGVDYTKVNPSFKRPSIQLVPADFADLDSMYRAIWTDRHIDLRHQPYVVLAPYSHSNLRSMPYPTWLEIIKELAKMKVAVVVIGAVTGKMPYADMTVGAFQQQLQAIGTNVISLVGMTPLRLLSSLISRAWAVVCLDSGPLYIAEAFRVPAISIWGPHHPGVRLGYDQEYMDLAIWNFQACNHSPCFAYRGFPVEKCPNGSAQTSCEVFRATEATQVMENMEKLARRSRPLAFKPGQKTGDHRTA